MRTITNHVRIAENHAITIDVIKLTTAHGAFCDILSAQARTCRKTPLKAAVLSRSKRHRGSSVLPRAPAWRLYAVDRFTQSKAQRAGGNSAGITSCHLLLLCNRCCCLMRGFVLLQDCPFFVGLSSSRRARSFMSRYRRASCLSNFASILRIRNSMRHLFQKCTWVDHGSYSNSHICVMRVNHCNHATSRPAWRGSQRSMTADLCFLDSARYQAYILCINKKIYK